jgi:hypothetical protein
MRKRLQRSSGTAITARDVLRTYRQDSRETASAADIAAIEQGEGRTLFCHYRGSYGSYPKRFAGCMLDLTSDGPVIRPMLFLRFLWQRIPISERVISAEVRPFGSEREAFQLASTGQFARGRRLEQSGYAVICCHTFGASWSSPPDVRTSTWCCASFTARQSKHGALSRLTMRSRSRRPR